MKREKTGIFNLVMLTALLIFSASCEKDNEEIDEKNDTSVTDVDGNIYTIIEIGSYQWMVENLKTTTYNDGTDIPLISSNSEWVDQNEGAYTWYHNNDESYGKTYGALYNWHAVNTGKLCPFGWRVPTDDEWKVLEGFVDEKYGTEDPEWDKTLFRGHNAGDRLKSSSGWEEGGNGSDDYGFSAYPGGRRSFVNGDFYSDGSRGFWWTASEIDDTYSWSRSMYYDSDNVSRVSLNKGSGFSVRCMRDID